MAPVPDGHVMVAVPAGHMIQMHPTQPGAQFNTPPHPLQGHQPGVVPDIMQSGMKSAMDAALAPPAPAKPSAVNEEAGETPQVEAAELTPDNEGGDPKAKAKKKKKKHAGK